MALGVKPLRPDHVIFTESLEYLVEEVLAQHGTWVKDRSTLDIQNIGDQDSQQGEDSDENKEPGGLRSWQSLMFVEKTFVCLAPVRSCAITTVSSTDVRNPDANPRRVELWELV